jgi:hypothetical protein
MDTAVYLDKRLCSDDINASSRVPARDVFSPMGPIRSQATQLHIPHCITVAKAYQVDDTWQVTILR